MIDVALMRAHLGMTQGELAERLGVRRETVNRWEAGAQPPSPLALHALRGLMLAARHAEQAAVGGR